MSKAAIVMEHHQCLISEALYATAVKGTLLRQGI